MLNAALRARQPGPWRQAYDFAVDRKRKSQILLTIWLSLPVLLIAGLMYAVAWSIDHGPVEGQPREPVGAGGGDTGGANAIGEALRDSDSPDKDDSSDDSGDDPEPDR